MSGQYTILGKVQHDEVSFFGKRHLWKCSYNTTAEQHELEFQFEDYFKKGSLRLAPSNTEVMTCVCKKASVKEIFLGRSNWDLLAEGKPFAQVSVRGMELHIRTIFGAEASLGFGQPNMENDRFAFSADQSNLAVNFAVNDTALIYPLLFCMVFIAEHQFFSTA